MRILMTDINDGTLVAAEVIEVGYDPDDKEFWAETATGDGFYFEGVEPYDAAAYTRTIARDGFLDLSNLKAETPFLNEEDGYEDNEDESEDNTHL